MSPTPLESLTACGTRLWLDSVDPELIRENRALGATGATSNPIIIADLIRSGRFDDQLHTLMATGLNDQDAAWAMTNQLVSEAQGVFRDVWEATQGDDGYVSFELDPLLEDVDCPLSIEERTSKYVTSGVEWAAGQPNRMIKVPATEAGLAALEELVAHDVSVNVTLIFTQRQYEAARDAVWRGARRRASLDLFKSVYSIFVSRVDVYTAQHIPKLSEHAQGTVGIVNAQRIFLENRRFWNDKHVPLRQEMIFASTGTKNPSDPVDKYVSALAGADIQTNPPGTNAAVQQLAGRVFEPLVDQLPPTDVLAEIDRLVNFAHLEQTLMSEGLQKFADPQKHLIALMAEKRQTFRVAS
jgi:transaldolase